MNGFTVAIGQVDLGGLSHHVWFGEGMIDGMLTRGSRWT